jgi:hypothetical protein
MGSRDPKGYYAILGVRVNADTAEVKAAYRRKAMELHPDRNGSADATRQFQLLNEAYATLGNPASRAKYDTTPAHPVEEPAGKRRKVPDPVVCSCCGKVTAQPRYAVFLEVKSFLLVTKRSAIQGIFCSACAEKKAFKASAVTWLLGWWGFPWGPIYSVQALATNMVGGKRQTSANARLVARQARFFAATGKIEMARAIAMDALGLAKRIGVNSKPRQDKKARGGEIEDEGAALRAQIETLLGTLGGAGGVRLKDAWRLMRRPFYVQGIVAAAVAGGLWYAIGNTSSSSPWHRPSEALMNALPQWSKGYFAVPPTGAPPPAAPEPASPAYARPAAAPNGVPWPVTAAYVSGYPRANASGLSKVTVDNSQNDSDVFAKLVSVDGANAYPARTFYIPAHSRFTVENIAVGSYDIRYRDLRTGGLARTELFNLEQTRVYNGTQFSETTLTLYKVRDGSRQTYGLAEDEF